MKKLVSLALTLVLALTLAVPSHAAEPEAQAETVGVILNGERVAFSGAAPELRDGKTMVPLRDLVESMGGEVTAHSGTLVCTFAGADGEKDTEVSVRPDESCYYKNGCTYVPVRAIAEPLGYDVFWDSGERSAVLIDRQAVIDRIDQQFTILNGALKQLQQEQDPNKNYRAQVDYILSVDALDEISGQRTQVKIDLSAATLISSGAIELELHTDLRDLGDLFLRDMVNNGAMTELQAAAIGKALEDLTLEGRYDITTGDLYFRFPALAQLNALTGLNASRDDWYHLTLPPMSSLEDLSSIWMDSLGISQELVEQIESGKLNSVGGIIYLYSTLLSQAPSQITDNAEEAGKILAQLFGDANFQTSGTTRKLHIGPQELEDLLGQEGALEEMFKTLGLDLTVRRDGSLAVALELAFREDYLDGESASLKGNMDLSKNKVVLDVTLHLSDLINFQYHMTETIRETTEKPQTAPPAGAAVVELGDLEALMDMSPESSAQVSAAA